MWFCRLLTAQDPPAEQSAEEVGSLFSALLLLRTLCLLSALGKIEPSPFYLSPSGFSWLMFCRQDPPDTKTGAAWSFLKNWICYSRTSGRVLCRGPASFLLLLQLQPLPRPCPPPTQLTAYGTHTSFTNPAFLALTQDSSDARSRLEASLGGFQNFLPLAGWAKCGRGRSWEGRRRPQERSLFSCGQSIGDLDETEFLV